MPDRVALAQADGCDVILADRPDATFVLFDPAGGVTRACRPDRARTRFLPASTFKVPHALIALQTGVVVDPYRAVPWDGRVRRVSRWNEPASLASGITHSVIWFYQGTARAIGHRRMAAWVARLHYGNARIGAPAELTHFWLDGVLSISALEQVQFLDRLRRGTLPADERHQASVRDMLRVDEGSLPGGGAWALYAKSGAVLPVDAGTGDLSDAASDRARLDGDERVGWYIGWVERAPAAGGDRVFAFNLRLHDRTDLGLRAELSRRLLAANGVDFD